MLQIEEKELSEIYAFAISLTKRAGKLLFNAAEKRYGDVDDRGLNTSHVEKENAVDLVTQTDNGM